MLGLDSFLANLNQNFSNKNKVDHLWLGKELAEKGHITQALFNWEQARQNNSEETRQLINQWHLEYQDKGQQEPLLATGLIKLKFQPKDSHLYYEVGCLARKLGRDDLGINLFRLAIRYNPEHEFAFCNLAAMLAKSPLEDGAVNEEIRHWFGDEDFHYPPFLSQANLIQETEKKILQERKIQFEQERAELEKQKQDAEAQINVLAIFKINQQIKQSIKKEDEITYEDILLFLKAQISFDKENLGVDLQVQKKLYDLGLFALQRGDGESALDCFQHLQHLKCNFPYLEMLLTLALAKSGQVVEATQQLNQILNEDQFDRFAHANLGRLYLDSGNRLLGFKHFLIAADLLQKSEGLYNFKEFIAMAEAAYDDKDYPKAMKYYQQIAIETDDLVAWSRITNLHMLKKEYEPASRAVREVIRISPQMEYAVIKLNQLHNRFVVEGDKLEALNKSSAALNFYKKALKINKNLDTVKKAHQLAVKLNKAEDAISLEKEIAVLSEAKRQSERTRQAEELIKKAMTFISNGQVDKAIANLEQALETKVDRSVFLTLCELYEEQGNYQQKKALEKKWASLLEKEEEERKLKKDMERYFFQSNH